MFLSHLSNPNFFWANLAYQRLLQMRDLLWWKLNFAYFLNSHTPSGAGIPCEPYGYKGQEVVQRASATYFTNNDFWRIVWGLYQNVVFPDPFLSNPMSSTFGARKNHLGGQRWHFSLSSNILNCIAYLIHLDISSRSKTLQNLEGDQVPLRGKISLCYDQNSR